MNKDLNLILIHILHIDVMELLITNFLDNFQPSIKKILINLNLVLI